MAGSAQQGPYYQISDTKNADLLLERQSATFNVEDMTQFMFGSPENYFDINKRRELSKREQNIQY